MCLSLFLTGHVCLAVFELYAMLKAGSMDFVGQKQAGVEPWQHVLVP